MAKARARFIAGIAALVLSGLPVGAQETVAVGHVASFMEEVEAALDLDQGPEIARLQVVYRSHFDAQALTRAIAPVEFLDRATGAERDDFITVLLCRMAVATSREGGVDGIGPWVLLGTRPGREGPIVALRLTPETGGQRTLIFELSEVEDSALILDIRSEGGRLSTRIANDIRREAGIPDPDEPVSDWLDRVICHL